MKRRFSFSAFATATRETPSCMISRADISAAGWLTGNLAGVFVVLSRRIDVKDKWIRIAFVVICLVLVLVVLVTPRHYEAVTLLRGTKFGMSPSEIRAIYESPDSEEESALAPELVLSYENKEYEGLPAEYHFRFVRVMLHYELYEAEITCQTDSESEREWISDKMLKDLQDGYGTLDGYYEEVTENEPRVGVSRGAVQISAVVETNSSVIRARLSRIY